MRQTSVKLLQEQEFNSQWRLHTQNLILCMDSAPNDYLLYALTPPKYNNKTTRHDTSFQTSALGSFSFSWANISLT